MKKKTIITALLVLLALGVSARLTGQRGVYSDFAELQRKDTVSQVNAEVSETVELMGIF